MVSSSLMKTQTNKWISAGAWLLALGLLAVAVYLGLRATGFDPLRASPGEPTGKDSANPFASLPAEQVQQGQDVDLPAYAPVQPEGGSIPRFALLHTIIPSRQRQEVHNYTVSIGDSVFEIASKFKLKPESVLWANYAKLNDNPDLISVGMELNIPPVDGVYYEWQPGDTVDGVAGRFEVSVEDILSFSANEIDLTNPDIAPGTWVMVPGGRREFRQWLIPVIPRGRAGVSPSVYGAGACEGGYEGAFGSGAFIWPAGNHSLSGNDYWDGHLGIDIAAGEGAPLYAADSGVVVFAGGAFGGYGNMVMIDHGNGYQTVYAHMSSVSVSCGRSLSQGATIGYSGSTGNSTGAHLHFEVRYQGGFVNPWYVLPAP
jgi:hypothetical protein